MPRFATVLLALLAFAAADEACFGGECPADSEEAAMLQHQHVQARDNCHYYDGFNFDANHPPDPSIAVCEWQYGDRFDKQKGATCDQSAPLTQGFLCNLVDGTRGKTNLQGYIDAPNGRGLGPTYLACNRDNSCIGWGIYGPNCHSCQEAIPR